MINRGKMYWGQNFKSYPYCKYYYGDRHYYFEYQKLLAYISKKHGITKDNKWDLVVDFCSFERKEIKSVIRSLGDLCKLYVFISSDSVYDVCDENIRKEVLIKEEYAIRPENELTLKKLNNGEDYGNDKLRCEEYLLSHVKDKFNYCCLRLPDVIGPFDSSSRFWGYLRWLQNSKEHPVHFNKFTQLRKLSLVYSEDVTIFLLNLLDKCRKNDNNYLAKINKESFNLSFDENYTLFEFLQSISNKINIPVIVLHFIKLIKYKNIIYFVLYLEIMKY